MKSYTQLMEELRAERIADGEVLQEGTVHLAPHGGKGTHFKVVKGIKGQLDDGEVIHDSHVDDLHDMGIKTKILKEEELSEEEQAIFESETLVELDFGDEDEEDGNEINELSTTKMGKYAVKALGNNKDGKRSAGVQLATKKVATKNAASIAATGETEGNRARRLANESAPDFNAPERTNAEEIQIARGFTHGDYKGHQSAMMKKHGIAKSASSKEVMDRQREQRTASDKAKGHSG